jgi:hypothetical protein
MTSPIVPPYLILRARVGVIFNREIAEAQRAGNYWAAAQLLNLRNEILAAIDPELEGGDVPRT